MIEKEHIKRMRFRIKWNRSKNTGQQTTTLKVV
jgi:hypothetical protein